jgi:hypothetical protein
MTEFRVASFSQKDDPIEDFFAVPKLVEGLTQDQATAEAAGTRSLLAASNTYYRNADSRSFVAYRGDAPVGRLTGFHNRLLTDQHRRYGLVGLFAC